MNRQKLKKFIREWGLSLLLIGPWVALLSSCGDDASTGDFTQVERLGRPAINEGLVLSSKFLAAFNQIGPELDLEPVAADVRTEVVAVLGLIERKSVALSLDSPGTPNTADNLAAHVANGFLPDVLRIDTSQASGFNASLQTVDGKYAMLTGGRLIEDDVADIILSYLFNGDATGASVKDNVSYDGGGGANADLQGHTALATTFPYLARPN